jgi:hypothetical protein
LANEVGVALLLASASVTPALSALDDDSALSAIAQKKSSL